MCRFARSFPFILLAVLCSIVDAAGDGFIVVPPPERPVPIPRPVPEDHFSFAPLEVRYHRVDVKISEQTARTAIDQEFRNPTNQRLEGYYIFPMPKGAHIDSFSMDVDGKMTEAELLDADKARKIYEDIVRRAKDPALLEYAGRDAFKVRIFPIEPRGTKRVKISYTEVLQSDNQIVEYVYPLNTEKFSAKPLDNVAVKVEIDSKRPLRSIYSPTHEVEIKRHGDSKAVVGFEAGNVRPDTDFHLVYSQRREGIAVDFLPHRANEKEDGHFMLMVSPGAAPEKKDILPKDICFVLDTSGSMMGAKLKQAKRSLLFCLENLNEDDRFEIVRFSTEAEPLFSELRTVSPDSREHAADFIEGFKPIGGTAIQEALALAMDTNPANKTGRPYSVVFLTDGLPTIGETREDSLVKNVTKIAGNARVFAFGLGTDVNTHLLDRVAEGTGGRSQYVLPDEDLELKLSSFYRKISNPAMTDLQLEFTGDNIRTAKIYPNRLPNLFHGDQLLVFGQFNGHGASAVKLTGTIGGETKTIAQDVSFPKQRKENAYIAEMWATRRVGWLLDEIRRNGESKEIKDEVTALARQYGIVTPYTAYLIMEDEQRRDIPAAQRNMREMESDREASGRVGENYDSLRREAAEESARSGDQAVFNVKSLQSLKYGHSTAASKPAAEALAKSEATADGGSAGYRSSTNYAQQVRVIQGRAFYQNGQVWTDSTAQARKNLREKTIPFNSDEYFELLRKHPESAQWLALGRNVDVVIGKTVYQVRAN
ncbi:MAG: VIT domain-containing protein [Verrucomicrobiota bacterium]